MEQYHQNTVDLVLEHRWVTFGIPLDYVWNTVGFSIVTPLGYVWNSVGLRLEHRWI